MPTCRNCKSPIKDVITTQTPECPVCGAWWPQGFGGLWAVAAMFVVYAVYLALRS